MVFKKKSGNSSKQWFKLQINRAKQFLLIVVGVQAMCSTKQIDFRAKNSGAKVST